MVVMDCIHERRVCSSSSSSRSREDCASGRFVPSEWVGAQCVLPSSWHGIEHTESSLEVLLSNGGRVEIGDGFNDETLLRLVAVLEQL